jgi:hypothetical protein
MTGLIVSPAGRCGCLRARRALRTGFVVMAMILGNDPVTVWLAY